MEFRKAERRKAKLRLGITGTAGSGKTYGALLVAKGLGGKVVLIDTENGSGDLYATLFDYDELEKKMYNGLIPKDLILEMDNFKVVKDVETLRIKKED